jgi:predicted small secreted protein
MRKKTATVFACLVLFASASSVLSACNTIEGAGKDVQTVGNKVSEEAKEHK